jgi:hypothetical protein
VAQGAGPEFKTQYRKKKNPKTKTQHKKRAGGGAQVVECLSSKCEALSSNFSTAKKKRKKEKVKQYPFSIYLPLILPNIGKT